MSSLLRSTKLVRYFTGAARTLILNSAKTADANLLINPKALSASNNVLLRDYATKKSESLDPLLQKLDLEVRRFGRITKKDIDEVFDELRANHDITSSQSLLVIRCCGDLVPEELPEQRTLLVQKIWNVLTERGIPMDVSHYNALLRVYIENEHPFSPAKFLEEMEKKGLQPNRVTYQRLMWRYCQEGDVDGATKVLEKMRELNMPVSEPVLNALIMGHAFHGDTDGAKAVLDTMAGAGLKPSNRTYALLACGYAKQGDIVNVENIITAAKEQDNHLTDKDLLDIVEQLALGGHGDKVEQIFPHFHKSFGYNQEVCNLILKLLNKGHEDIAKKVMKTMPKSSNQEDTMFKGAFYVKHLLKVKKSADEIIQSCRELQNEGLVPNALYIATEASLNLGRSELAQKLFKELQNDGMEIRQHYYWPLLVQKGKEHDEEGLLQIVRDMTNEGLTPSGEALRDYVIPYMMETDTPQNIITKLQLANVPTFHSARNVMVELLHAGEIQKAANITFNYRPRGQYALIRRPLLNALNKTKDINSFVNILHVISSGPFTPQEDVSNEDTAADENIITNEISRTLKSGIKIVARDNMTEALLKKALTKGLKISTAAAEDIQQYLGNNMTTAISELLAQLTSPDLEIAPLENSRRVQGQRTATQLEKLLEQVQSKDGNNLNRLRKQVLQAYINENNVEKVESLVEDFKSQQDFELTLSTLAQLFEFYCSNDLIDKAMEVKAQIAAKDPEFMLNKFKTVQMAYALVRANRFDEAVQFLKDNKSSSDVENASFILNSKCWQMLNSLAELKDEAKVKEMTSTLIDNGYIEPSNVILGPLIKVHLLKDDIESALKEFEHCCQQYRSTPWKGELMKALILKEDATKLQWLADLSTQIHGEVNILHDLVLAFVECGRLRQARRILETPGLQTRHKRLTDACLRYVEEGKSEYLEGLLEATKELSHIDRSNIFYHLLVSYCKADETDKALGLWTVLQEEGEVPSDQFLTYLGNHLKSKNIQVPFVIPEEQVALKQEKPDKPKTTPVIKRTENEPSKPVKRDVTAQIEKLTQEGKTSQAVDCALKSIEGGVFPQPKVLKFLLKNLAQQGNVEKIEALGHHLNDTMRRNVTYDDKLTLAVFTRGNGAQHVDKVLQELESAQTDEHIESALRKFPRSNALARAVQDDNLVAKCKDFWNEVPFLHGTDLVGSRRKKSAENFPLRPPQMALIQKGHKVAELAASKGYVLPANLLWMEYLLAGKDNEADSLWKKCLQNASVVVFRRLLQESHTRREPQTIEKLIEILKTNKQVSPASIGNAYSRLINYYIVDNKLDEAKKVLDRAFESGVASENLNKTSLKRLKEALEATGKTFEYAV